jgi:hypothetical protein
VVLIWAMQTRSIQPTPHLWIIPHRVGRGRTAGQRQGVQCGR